MRRDFLRDYIQSQLKLRLDIPKEDDLGRLAHKVPHPKGGIYRALGIFFVAYHPPKGIQFGPSPETNQLYRLWDPFQATTLYANLPKQPATFLTSTEQHCQNKKRGPITLGPTERHSP